MKKDKDKCTCNNCECEENKETNKCDCKDNCEDNCNCENECNCNEELIQNLQNELLKSKADFINYRKRLEDEHLKFVKYCNEDLIKQILPTLDNFERAINMDDKNLTDEVSKFLSGFKMIYCTFVDILKKSGVVEIDGNNKPFNPVYHEAIMTEKREGVLPGMVLDVLQKGYILNGKVIRPAMVRVSE